MVDSALWRPTGRHPGSSTRRSPTPIRPTSRGSVRCTAPEGGRFTGVAVELDAANRIFTTLPVVPLPERMSQE